MVIQYVGGEDYSKENSMNREILVVTFGLIILPVLVWLATDAVEARSSYTITQSVRLARCFQDNELSESLTTLKLQAGPDVRRVYPSLLAKARTTPGCRTQLVQALIRVMEQASKTTNHIENYPLWQNGASMLADLKATEALDLLITNIDFSDGFESSLSDFPALIAILRIGAPAIPKLQVVLRNDPVPHRRKFAAYSIAYIGGSQARRTLTNAMQVETDPCVEKLLQLSVQAFDTKMSPNQIRSALNGKWLPAFHCL
jgi:hypothetical protein